MGITHSKITLLQPRKPLDNTKIFQIGQVLYCRCLCRDSVCSHAYQRRLSFYFSLFFCIKDLNSLVYVYFLFLFLVTFFSSSWLGTSALGDIPNGIGFPFKVLSMLLFRAAQLEVTRHCGIPPFVK